MQLVTQKLIKQLEKANLPTEDRIALTDAIMHKLNALPIGDLITFTQDGIMINGRMLGVEDLLAFREATSVLKDNYARKVISEQIRFKAIDMGINKATSIDTLIFAKACLWVMNEHELLIHTLSDRT